MHHLIGTDFLIFYFFFQIRLDISFCAAQVNGASSYNRCLYFVILYMITTLSFLLCLKHVTHHACRRPLQSTRYTGPINLWRHEWKSVAFFHDVFTRWEVIFPSDSPSTPRPELHQLYWGRGDCQKFLPSCWRASVNNCLKLSMMTDGQGEYLV